MAEKEQDEEKRASGRSPAYPFIPLNKALRRADELRKAIGKNETRVASAMNHWGYASKSSGGIQTVAALKHFGLISDSGALAERRVKLTDMALRILLDQRGDNPEKQGWIQKAAITPKLHKELWDKWGADLPVDAEIRHYLVLDRNFSEKGAEDLINEYKATLAFAKMRDSGSMSDIEEDIRESIAETQKPMNPAPGTTKPEVPALKTGRLQEVFNLQEGQAILQLPEQMSPESYEDFEAWLQLVLRKAKRSVKSTEQ